MKFINSEKIDKIKLTKNNFFIAIDFDKTITSMESEDSWDATGHNLGEMFEKEITELYKKYRPIELNYDISFDEKYIAMEEWYNSCMDLYYKYNLTKENLENSIENSKLIFRTGAKEFLINMKKNNVPIIILSAGIGNVIEKFLENNNCYFNNIFIISNFIKFDRNGKMLKQKGELIHTLNKTMEGHINSEMLKQINNKEFRILFGDLVEDKNMIEKNEWDKTLSVGFLDKNINENLETYKNNFDIVLTEKDADYENIYNIINI